MRGYRQQAVKRGDGPRRDQVEPPARALRLSRDHRYPAAKAKRLDGPREEFGAQPARLDELPRVERMMRRVLQLDETYYHGGAHVFFGVYYGGRAPMFGGDFARAETHFARAKALAPGFLWVDVYRARYLLRQRGEREAFHAALTAVLAAPAADPELNLANALARKQAAALLAQEEELF